MSFQAENKLNSSYVDVDWVTEWARLEGRVQGWRWLMEAALWSTPPSRAQGAVWCCSKWVAELVTHLLTDAPFKLILSHLITMRATSHHTNALPQHIHQNRNQRHSMVTFSLYLIGSEESHSLLSLQFFINQHRMGQKAVLQASERQGTLLFTLVRCCKELPRTNSSPQ